MAGRRKATGSSSAHRWSATFVYRGAAAFTGGADNSEARVSGSTVLIDVNGDGTAEIAVTLTGLTNAAQISASDFLFG